MSNSVIRFRFTHLSDSELEWHIRDVVCEEELSRAYELVCLLATDQSTDPEQLLGADVRVEAEGESITRAWCGIVRSIEKGLAHEDYTRGAQGTVAKVWIVPALVALEHTQDTRIFQEKTTVEILEQVLGDGLAPYRRRVDTSKLAATYPVREYCVQYAESDFHFASRLMEEEGIVYWFTHDGDQEVLVLGDANTQFDEAPQEGSGPIPVQARHGLQEDTRESIFDFVEDVALTSTSIAVRDYDWTHPSVSVEAAVDGEDPLGRSREVFVYGETHLTEFASGSGYGAQDSDRRSTLESERHAVGTRSCNGSSRAIGFSPGRTFAAANPAQPDMDGDYALVRVQHRFTAVAGTAEAYDNEFSCVAKATPWRPARTHLRPEVSSIETAIVVGPAGEEIHTDEHGRVKVQFHWDRHGANDEHSSCWLRVMQPWAGAGWGFLWIPRIGMEVIVHFLDANPDRPIVLGSLYHGENRPPYPLPDEKTKSTIKSNSTPGGGGSNELRYEDKAGSEEIYLHAQKNLLEQVLNDHNTKVGNNQTNTIEVDQTEDVGANQSLTVDANRTVHVKAAFDETIDGGETRNVTAGVTETISGSETRSVSGGVTETINGGETRTVNGAQTETINGSLTRTIGSTATETISGAFTQTITGGAVITTPAAYNLTVSGTASLTAPGGALFVSTAGHKIVASGGQTWIDNDYFKIGSLTKDRFDSKAVVCGFVASLIGVQVRMMGVKIDTYGFTSESTSRPDTKKGQTELVVAGTALKKYAKKAIRASLSLFM